MSSLAEENKNKSPLAEFFDQLGTNLGLPEIGLSEALNGGQQTTNTDNPAGYDLTGGIYQTENQIQPVSSTNLGTSANTSGTSTTGQVLGAQDPYLAYGGQANYEALRNGFNTQKANLLGSANTSLTNTGNRFGLSVQETIDNLLSNQQAIDNKNIQNESSKIQSNRDIMDMVGRGIRSGGMMLGNRNAGSSSAAQAIADAYGQLGQREASAVGNQYTDNAADIGIEQAALNRSMTNKKKEFELSVNETVDNVVADVQEKLATLNAEMVNASLPDRIAIDQEIQAVKNQGMAILQPYLARLNTGVSGAKATGRDANIASANEKLAAGKADPSMFKYTTQQPARFQGTGQYASELPIFTNQNKRRLA